MKHKNLNVGMQVISKSYSEADIPFNVTVISLNEDTFDGVVTTEGGFYDCGELGYNFDPIHFKYLDK